MEDEPWRRLHVKRGGGPLSCATWGPPTIPASLCRAGEGSAFTPIPGVDLDESGRSATTIASPNRTLNLQIPRKSNAAAFRQGADQGSCLRRRLHAIFAPPPHRPLRPEGNDQRSEKKRRLIPSAAKRCGWHGQASCPPRPQKNKERKRIFDGLPKPDNLYYFAIDTCVATRAATLGTLAFRRRRRPRAARLVEIAEREYLCAGLRPPSHGVYPVKLDHFGICACSFGVWIRSVSPSLPCSPDDRITSHPVELVGSTISLMLEGIGLG